MGGRYGFSASGGDSCGFPGADRSRNLLAIPIRTREYYDALDHWFFTRHGYHVELETVTVGCGVVYGLATGVKAFTKEGDAILIQQPVYYPFREVIEDNGRVFINNQLHYENGRYTVDFEDFERKIVENQVKVFLLCNPHNPVGRVWTKEELERMGDICLRHHVIIMDDEIHCDFVYPGYHFTSFMTLDEKYQENLVLYTTQQDLLMWQDSSRPISSS